MQGGSSITLALGSFKLSKSALNQCTSAQSQMVSAEGHLAAHLFRQTLDWKGVYIFFRLLKLALI